MGAAGADLQRKHQGATAGAVDALKNLLSKAKDEEASRPL